MKIQCQPGKQKNTDKLAKKQSCSHRYTNSSNNAAVALMTPIGIAIAQSIGIEPYGFVMACLFGSGIGCLTPMATPILSFVMDGGHYTPKDIFKWGLLECLCTAIAVAICVPLLWM